ncbi:MAG: succinate dehydrogenase cytochrome b subunit [Verrucomicrobiia bacterium]|jgi:succinate dehydrogenase / fumarate reductase cytochrome b subunit
MNIISNIFKSSLGKKYIMGLTGFMLVGFIFGHLAGNLLVFLGPDAINSYGALLKSSPKVLWGARIGLIVGVLLHIAVGILLHSENKAARPVGYLESKATEASYASQFMRGSGIVVFFFILYHLLHFTVMLDWVNGTGLDFHMLKDSAGRHDIYRMLIIGFQNPWVSISYAVAIILLSLHLSHGLSAMFHSLGLKTPAWTKPIELFAKVGSAIVLVGYLSIPIAVLTGILTFAEKGAQ